MYDNVYKFHCIGKLDESETLFFVTIIFIECTK